jgi:hypothetical protein
MKNQVLGLILLLVMFAGCEKDVTEPEIQLGFDNSVLFIEYGTISTLGSSSNQDVYQFNEYKRFLKVDSNYNDPIEPSTKFVFGSYTITLSDNDGYRSENFIQQTEFPAQHNIATFYHTYHIEMIECTPEGKIKILFIGNINTQLFEGEEITLEPGEVFETIRDISIGVIIYKYIITITNKGFVKKSDITYY